MTVPINTFYVKQDHTFTKIYKLYNHMTTKKFSSITADAEWREAVNAMAVKNVKDANVPLKLLPICREYVNVVLRFGCKKTHFHLHYIFNAF